MTIRRKTSAMTGAQYMSALARLGLSQVQAARFLNIGVRTSHSYANGQRIPRAVQLLLNLMIEHNVTPESVGSPAFIPIKHLPGRKAPAAKRKELAENASN